MSFVEKWVKQDHHIQQDKSDPERQILHISTILEWRLENIWYENRHGGPCGGQRRAQGWVVKDSQILALSRK